MATNEKSKGDVQHDEIHADHNVTIEEAALIADGAQQAKPFLWTPSMLRLYCCLLDGYLCATTNGFDGGSPDG